MSIGMFYCTFILTNTIYDKYIKNYHTLRAEILTLRLSELISRKSKVLLLIINTGLICFVCIMDSKNYIRLQLLYNTKNDPNIILKNQKPTPHVIRTSQTPL